MEKQISFQKFSKILKFGMKVINPYDGAGEGAKLTRLYRFFIATNLSMILVSVSFFVLENPGVAAMSEAAVTALLFVRSTFYMLVIIAKNSSWQASLGKIIEERKSVNELDKKRFDLTVEYCRDEVKWFTFFFKVYWVAAAIGCIFGPLLHLNDLRLPLNFYIPFLKFDDIGWKWLLSYTFQIVNCCFFALFFTAFVSLTLVLLNQNCLKVDEVSLVVEKLNQSLTDSLIDKPKSDETEATTSGAIRKVVAADKTAMKNAEIKEHIKRIAEMINSVNEWREESQNLMQLNFLIEFLILSFCFALCLFTLSEEVVGSISVLLALCVILFQLFLYCWLGTRLDILVEKLAASLYDIQWQVMNVQQQKEILLMLTMTQNIEGFDGVFERVNFETFKEILNFSYSLFGFLKAIN